MNRMTSHERNKSFDCINLESLSSSNVCNTACEWEGIECNGKEEVIAIILADLGLSASIPPELTELSSLKSLRLEKNKLRGSIPSEFGHHWKDLESVDLSLNLLTGTIPQHTFASTKLRILHLDGNNFHGSIPSHIVPKGNFLESLSLKNNRLAGMIPSSLNLYSNLDILDFSNNLLHGTIPNTIGDLTVLQRLHLQHNYLVGYIPPTIADPHSINGRVGDNLQHIFLQNNHLSGNVPIQLTDLPKLTHFKIHENKLTGDLPIDLCSADINPEFFEAVVDGVDRNYCDAIACPMDHVANDGIYPCVRCHMPHFNPYIGQEKTCQVSLTEREILKRFYESTSENGGWYGVGNNWEDDKTFLCDFKGVSCDDNFHVTDLRLSGQGLAGVIPHEIGFLKYLEVLDLSDNDDLEGYLPSDLRWAPLKSLDISGSRVKGIIPPKLCEKNGINGNGSGGDYNCDHLACPAGTYNSKGRKIVGSDKTCKQCHYNSHQVLGSKSCGPNSNVLVSESFGGVFIFFFLTFLSLMYLSIRSRRKQQLEVRMSEMVDLSSSSEANSATSTNVASTTSIVEPNESDLRKQNDETTPQKSNYYKNRRQSYAPVQQDQGYEENGMRFMMQNQNRNSPRSILSGGSGKSSRSTATGSDESSMWLDVPNIT